MMDRENILQALEEAQRKMAFWAQECNQLEEEFQMAEEEFEAAEQRVIDLETKLNRFDETYNG